MPRNIDKSSNVLYLGQKLELHQTSDFSQWFRKLRDATVRARISKRLRRLADGNHGDCKSIGDGVHELRMFFGPGYRVYFMHRNEMLTILLAGGDKDSQARDIVLAKKLAGKENDGIADDTI